MAGAIKNRVPVTRSERGFSLPELMLTVSIFSIVVLGTTFLFSDFAQIQKRSGVGASINQMRSNLIANITQTRANPADPTPWNLSVADVTGATGNPALACLRDRTPCVKDTPVRLNLKNFDGTEAFYSRTASRGFTVDGLLCNTFDPVDGNGACPFSWQIEVVARCVGADKPSCDNPTIEVNGRLQYSPGNAEPLGGTPFNPDPYAFTVRRGERRDLNEPVVFAYVENDNSGEAGSCEGTWLSRRLNTEISDPGANGVIAAGGDGFRLEPGAYDCRFTVPAFKNDANQIRLVRQVGAMSAVIATSGVATASMNGESVNVTLQVAFSSTQAADTFRVQHLCSKRPALQVPFFGSGDAFMLGVPSRGAGGSYTGTTFTTAYCLKTSGL